MKFFELREKSIKGTSVGHVINLSPDQKLQIVGLKIYSTESLNFGDT